mmetsp:Transcript_36414/g.104909  ORF Transcript_36414/g.104909 Transcript_36414/m.104909 type:complete len:219 (+) Transcript_36414:973-1629(+)
MGLRSRQRLLHLLRQTLLARLQAHRLRCSRGCGKHHPARVVPVRIGPCGDASARGWAPSAKHLRSVVDRLEASPRAKAQRLRRRHRRRRRPGKRKLPRGGIEAFQAPLLVAALASAHRRGGVAVLRQHRSEQLLLHPRPFRHPDTHDLPAQRGRRRRCRKHHGVTRHAVGFSARGTHPRSGRRGPAAGGTLNRRITRFPPLCGAARAPGAVLCKIARP